MTNTQKDNPWERADDSSALTEDLALPMFEYALTDANGCGGVITIKFYPPEEEAGTTEWYHTCTIQFDGPNHAPFEQDLVVPWNWACEVTGFRIPEGDKVQQNI